MATIEARFAELDTVDGERLAALQAALAAAERRDAYEAAAASHVAWLEETIGAVRFARLPPASIQPPLPRTH